MFLFLCGRMCALFLLRACAGRITFLATFCFVYPLLYEVAMPSETNSAKERQNVRSRALMALETPGKKLVRREKRNEKDMFLVTPSMHGIAAITGNMRSNSTK